MEDLRSFPVSARREAGYQLDRVQGGLMPTDFKPMPGIGKSVLEIRVQEASGAFRVVYCAKFEGFIVVLHCFQKKTQKTSQKDMNLAKGRYQELMKELRDET